jgi:hypothetical protein
VFLGEGINYIKEAHMQIKIDLPISSILMDDDNQDYKTAEAFLKQLELAVHHAQKSLKQMREMEDENADGAKSYNVSLRVVDVEYYDEGNKIGNPAIAYIDLTTD